MKRIQATVMYCMDEQTYWDLASIGLHKISQVTQGSAWHGRESKTMTLGLTLHTSMSSCSFVNNGFTYSNTLQREQRGQCQVMQSRNNGTILIKELSMALQLLTLPSRQMSKGESGIWSTGNDKTKEWSYFYILPWWPRDYCLGPWSVSLGFETRSHILFCMTLDKLL